MKAGQFFCSDRDVNELDQRKLPALPRRGERRPRALFHMVQLPNAQ